MTITHLQVKQLYKELLKYGCSLKLTDKNYYKSRIKQEFLDNRQLVKPNEIQFFYDVSLQSVYTLVKYFKHLDPIIITILICLNCTYLDNLKYSV